MHYEDESKRLNLLSGLVIGLLMGSAIAFLLNPRVRRTSGVFGSSWRAASGWLPRRSRRRGFVQELLARSRR
jgi:hypothetical protein